MDLSPNKSVKNYEGHGQYKLSLMIIALVVATRLVLLELPKVNLEFAFSDAVNYFITGNKHLIDTYFQYQANTLGVSYIVYLLSKLATNLDVLTLGRLLSIFGLGLTGYSVYLLSKKLDCKKYTINILLAIVLLNPILWVYSGRFTADVFPLSIGLFGLVMLYEYNSNLKYFISSIFIAVSIVLKYHSILFLLVALIYIYLKDGKIKIGLLLYFLPSLILVSYYLVLIFQEFNFFLAPPHFQNTHKFSLNSWLSNAISYTSYIMLIFAPFSIIIFNQYFFQKDMRGRIIVILSIVLFGLASLLFYQSNGEMNFGPLDRFLPQKYSGFLQVLGLMFVYVFIKTGKDIRLAKNNTILLSLFITCVSFIVIFSFTRPAQRYLLYIVPFMYIMLVSLYKYQVRVKIILPVLVVFVMLNIYSSAYQYVVGTAADNMAKKIVSLGYLHDTDLGAIKPHVGDIRRRGYGDGSCVKYRVVYGELPDSTLTTKETLFGIVKRTYSLINTNARQC